MSELSPGRELDMAVKQAVKPYEVAGFPVSIKDGKFQVENPTGALGKGNETVESLLNAPDNAELTTGVGQKTADLLAGHLEKRFGQRQDCQDLIMYGPAKVGVIEDRMQRLQDIRDFATLCQTSAQRNNYKDMPDLIRAATFVRSNIQRIGLRTTINVLSSISTAKNT